NIRVGVDPQFGQAPQLPPVDGYKIAPMAARIDEAKKSCPPFVMQGRKLRRSEENTDTKTQYSFAPIFDAERLAREPVKAVATDEIAASNRFNLARFQIGQVNRYSVVFFDKRIHACAMPQSHCRQRRDMIEQDRIEKNLRTVARPLGRITQLR